MKQSNSHRSNNMTTKPRFLKTVTYALIHFSVTFSVAYLLTGDLLVGGAMAMIEPALNTVAFHFHEKAWHHFG